MTLSIAWVRQERTTEELVISTDSRLTGGYVWDIAPKIFTFSRGDCAICFAGDTSYAYPVMEQIRNTIETYEKSKIRALDLCDLKGHLDRTIQKMESCFVNEISGQSKQKILDANFIFAGFSWSLQKFLIWKLNFDSFKNKFVFTEQKNLYSSKLKDNYENKIKLLEKYSKSLLAEIVDHNKDKYNVSKNEFIEYILHQTGEEYIKIKKCIYHIIQCEILIRKYKAKATLCEHQIVIIGDYEEEVEIEIAEKIKLNSKNGTLNYEPFEVLRDYCRNENIRVIGGSPQLIKIYKHLNTMPYIMYWPDKLSRERTLFGRPLQYYEDPHFMTFDPDTLKAEDFTPYILTKEYNDFSI